MLLHTLRVHSGVVEDSGPGSSSASALHPRRLREKLSLSPQGSQQDGE